MDLKLARPAPAPLRVTIGHMEKFGPDISRIPLTIEVPPGSRPVDHLGDQQAPVASILFDTGLPDAKQLQIYVRYIVVE